jgi:hypothetical protein
MKKPGSFLLKEPGFALGHQAAALRMYLSTVDNFAW